MTNCISSILLPLHMTWRRDMCEGSSALTALVPWWTSASVSTMLLLMLNSCTYDARKFARLGHSSKA